MPENGGVMAQSGGGEKGQGGEGEADSLPPERLDFNPNSAILLI